MEFDLLILKVDLRRKKRYGVDFILEIRYLIRNKVVKIK